MCCRGGARPSSFLMRNTFQHCILWLALGLASSCVWAETNAPALKPEPRFAEIARRFSRRFPREHITREPLDDTMSSRMWTNYVSTLDPERVYFLQSDIDRFKLHEWALDDALKEGDLGFGYAVFSVFIERVQERCDYVDVLLAKGFDVLPQESLMWERDKAPWPSDSAEQNELWRKKIKNEYIRRLVAQELSAEEAGAVATNAASPGDGQSALREEPEGATLEEEQLTPEEWIRKRYRRLLTVLQDSDSEWILERYLSACAQAYDPHSLFMTASALEDFNIEMKLSLVGIGALLQSEDGAAKVVKLITGGPADRDTRDIRLRPGDKIIAVAQDDGPMVDVLHWPLRKAVSLIRGPKGSRVVLTVIPASDPTGASTREVDIIRDEVKLEDQAARGEVKDVKNAAGKTCKIGVITLPAFYVDLTTTKANAEGARSSVKDVEKIIGEMNAEEVDGIVLDLRENGGGSLVEAIRMTGLFISTGPVVQVKERYSNRILSDRDPRIAYDGPLIVLVSRISASASEILAGALQDYGRAIIVGDTKTHGKGTVQSVINVGRDESMGAAKVTSASYFRITGSSTQLKGVSADIVIPSAWEQLAKGEDSLSNPLAWSQERPASFLPVGDFEDLIPTLRERSESRRAADSRFQAQVRLLERLKEMAEAKEVSLNLGERKQQARAERELVELQNRLTAGIAGERDGLAEEDSGEGEPEAPDLILEECVAITADWVALRGGTETKDEESGRRRLADLLPKWLGGRL